mgnify:CR=1 FL=1
MILLASGEDNAYTPAAVWPDPARNLTHLGPTAEAALRERRGVVTGATDIDGVDVPDWNRYPRPEKLVELTRVSDATEANGLAERLADAITGHMTTANPRSAALLSRFAAIGNAARTTTAQSFFI